jgi:hypothetical protein
MTWRNRARRGGRRAWEFTRSGGARVQRVVSQQAAQARLKGRDLARKVVGIQLSAGMESSWKGRRLMQRSAESAAADPATGKWKGPAPSADWREGYAAEAAATLDSYPAYRGPVSRGLAAVLERMPEPDPFPEPEPAGPARPSWPDGPSMSPEAGS